jgi:hypothetical protein
MVRSSFTEASRAAAPDISQCACHGLTVLKAATLRPGSDSSGNPGIQITPAGQDGSHGLWQVDFQDVRWSVPGGLNLQFGVLGVGRPKADGTPYIWFNLASPGAERHLRWFDPDGKPVGTVDDPLRLHVQVWGHLSGNVKP